MENQAHGLTTDSTVNKRFSSVEQAGFMSMFKSSSVKRTACAIAFAVACVPTIALGEGISKLPAVSGQATISQAATSRPAAEPTDTKTAETVASKVLPSVVSVKATSDSSGSTGSGVVLNTNGDILTNYHVIEGMDTFSISVNDKEYECTVVGTDPTSDLAVLHADLKGDSLTPIEIGNSDNLAPGSWVMSVGSPFGLDHSVSAGIVSALSRGDMLETEGGETTIYANLIQVDAAINPGNSGGALVDSNGQLVGICTLFSSDTKSFAGIGFAIPSNYAIDIANQILSGQQVKHAYIGLSMQTVTPRVAKRNDLSVDYGAYVAGLLDDSPAEGAGIKKGDVIVSIGGERVVSADAAIIAVRSHKIGETVPVEIMRGEDRLTINVTLGSDETLSSMKEKEKNSKNETNNDTDDKQDRTEDDDDSYRYYRQQNYWEEFWDYFTNPYGDKDVDSDNPFVNFVESVTNSIAQVIYGIFG